MKVLKAIIYNGWALIILMAVAIVGYVYEWPIELLASVLSVVLIAGLVSAIVGSREKELEKSSHKLRQLAGY